MPTARRPHLRPQSLEEPVSNSACTFFALSLSRSVYTVLLRAVPSVECAPSRSTRTISKRPLLSLALPTAVLSASPAVCLEYTSMD